MGQGFQNYFRRLVLAVLLGLVIPGIVFAQEVEAILSSELGPYREAFDGFLDGFGGRVSPLILSKETIKISPGARVVVTFGAKAALSKYPDQATLVYCMAPGIRFGSEDRPGSSVEVQMLPQARLVLEKMREIQPNLKRLAVFWSSKSMEGYVEGLRRAAAAGPMEILSEKLNGPNDLPEELRNVYGKVDAIWLLPDPPLVNAESLSVLKEFSWSNHIPFYAPTGGFVEQGATVSISSSFREIGRAAGAAARRALSGRPDSETIYPEKVEITVSMKAAGNSGLQISPQVLKKVDRILP